MAENGCHMASVPRELSGKTGSPFNCKFLGKETEWLGLGQVTKQVWSGKWLYVVQEWLVLCMAVGVYHVPLKEDRKEAAQPNQKTSELVDKKPRLFSKPGTDLLCGFWKAYLPIW